MAAVRLEAPAKVNLHLGVHPGRDGRGYHRVDSLMAAVGLADVVEVAEGGTGTGLVLSMDGVNVDVAPERNTAHVAARRLAQAVGRPADLRISLEKRIPAQSGLGGSSSDAAAVLLALCQLWGLEAGDARVRQVAKSVGADVPFFLDLRPTLLAGYGDEPVESFPALGAAVVLVRPAGGVPTPAAYEAFDESPVEPKSPEAMAAALRTGDVAGVATSLSNNLAGAARAVEPQVADAERLLEAAPGVLGSQVTGSGSCCFGICESDEAARAVAEEAKLQGFWACATRFVAGR